MNLQEETDVAELAAFARRQQDQIETLAAQVRDLERVIAEIRRGR